MATKAETTAIRNDSLQVLRELLPVGSTAHTILRKVSSSGMSRQISVVVVTKDGVRDITWHVANVTGFKLADSNDFALKVGGCGMDMGFHVVYSLSSALYPEGHKCTGTDGWIEKPSDANGWAGRKSKTRHACPSNDHTNDYSELIRKFDQLHADDPRRTVDYHDPSGDGKDYHHEQRDWMAAQKTYTKSRLHTSGGYAIRQRWL